jgi:cytochrome b
MLPVWDVPVRILHWSLVLSVAMAWLTRHSPCHWHEWLGYIALGIVVARLAWGFTGSTYARFDGFIRPAAVMASYARDLV